MYMIMYDLTIPPGWRLSSFSWNFKHVDYLTVRVHFCCTSTLIIKDILIFYVHVEQYSHDNTNKLLPIFFHDNTKKLLLCWVP